MSVPGVDVALAAVPEVWGTWIVRTEYIWHLPLSSLEKHTPHVLSILSPDIKVEPEDFTPAS